MGWTIRDRGLVVAADVDSLEDLSRLVSATGQVEGIVGYKVGFTTVVRYGLPAVVETVRDHACSGVIYDHQKAGTDIPQMAEQFAGLCKRCGVDAAIVFPQAGPVTLQAFVEALLAQAVTPIVGGHMTHAGYLSTEEGYLRESAPREIYAKATELGVTEFVVPGNNPPLLRAYALLLQEITGNAGIWFPGIGRQGGDVGEACRAIGELRAYAIVGSGVYRAADPAAAATRLVADMDLRNQGEGVEHG